RFMKICGNCGCEFDGNFCPKCGKEFFGARVCRNCRAFVTGRFCPECGTEYKIVVKDADADSSDVTIGAGDGGSAGLEFKAKKNYCLVDWVGDCTDADIVIPSEHNGKPVKGIGDSAFIGCRFIESVYIPSGVEEIGDSAFEGCTWLEKIIISETVTQIGNSAFAGCEWLKTVTLPDGLKSINDNLFDGCVRLTDVNIPDGVRRIGQEAFKNCPRLFNVFLPVSVEDISPNIFQGSCPRMRCYYLGGEKDWNYVLFAMPQEDFGDEKLYFYYEERQKRLGNFWHRDENGDARVWW
ncbi:MAG: leucine-rich repeat protein, partial [Clostridia bacterium]|nr:leucine-rich repeat protein [Clostridia bacterium]